MARNRLPGPDDLEDVVTVESEDISKLQGDIDAEEAKITSEFDADNKDVKWLIKVYRVLEKEGRMNWLFNCIPSELPIIDKLRDNYGSGLYRARIYRNGTLHRALDYAIEAPKFLDQKPTQQQSQTPDITNIVNALLSAQERQFLKIQEILQNRVTPATSFDPMQMMSSMVAMMLQMKSFLTPAQNGTGNIELLLKGVELAKDLVSGNSETNFLDVIRDVIKSDAFTKAIEATASPGAKPETRIENKSIPVIPQQGEPMKKISDVVIKQYIEQLLQRAKRNSDPELYAAFILDNVAGTIYENQLIKFLSNENLISELIKIDARVASYTSWFEELRDSLVNMLTDENEVGDTTNNASKQSTTVPSNGATEGPGRNT